MPPEFEGRTYEDVDVAFQVAWSDDMIRWPDLYVQDGEALSGDLYVQDGGY